jgi:hypothetical protein
MVFWAAFFGAVRYVRLIDRQVARESILSDSRKAPHLQIENPN